MNAFRTSTARCLLLTSLALTGTVACAAELVPLSAEQQRALGLQLDAPKPAAVSLTRRYPARIAVPNRQLRVVAARKAGVVESLLVAEGEQVEAGQELARLQSPDLLAAQSGYLEALTRMQLAESEVARDRMLHREGVIAERRLLESQARREELATMVEQRRQVLALAGMAEVDIQALAETRVLTTSLPVRSPIKGVVLEQLVGSGESLASAAPLYRIAQLSSLWVEVHVPVDQLGQLEAGDGVLLPGLGIQGQIITIGRLVHGEDQGVLVRAQITEGVDRLRPGQFVEVQLAADSDGGSRWRVPAAAVVRHHGAAYVFAVRDGGFQALPVDILAEEDASTVVSGALSSADQLAVKGVVELKAAWLASEDSGANDGGGG